MTNSYLIHAWCIRRFITYLDPVEADTPEGAIAIARTHQDQLLDAAEECDYHVSAYPWDEFAAYDEHGKELLRVLDGEARLRNAAPVLRDTLLYVAGQLGAFKPDYLRQIGLDVALEQVEEALDLIDNPAGLASVAAEDGQD